MFFGILISTDAKSRNGFCGSSGVMLGADEDCEDRHKLHVSGQFACASTTVHLQVVLSATQAQVFWFEIQLTDSIEKLTSLSLHSNDDDIITTAYSSVT